MMGVINSTLTTFSDNPPGTPMIGYDNIVTDSNISSASFTTGFPITNVANPATHLYWKGGIITGSETIDIVNSNNRSISYVGIAGHNLGTAGISLSIIDMGNSPGANLLSASPILISDDTPIIARIAPAVYSTIRIQLSVHDVLPQAAVIYTGTLLVLSRGIKVDVAHVPLPYGRKTRVVNGMSESGNFLGRIVLSESRQSIAEFFGFDPTYYRANVEPFLAVANEFPFFWAWAPRDYPLESGFAWLTTDAQPEQSPDHRLMALTLNMEGIA